MLLSTSNFSKKLEACGISLHLQYHPKGERHMMAYTAQLKMIQWFAPKNFWYF